MKNAYLVLGIEQNASTIEIVKGQVNAMRAGKYSSADIAIAKKQLSTPAQRLAVDFTYPIITSSHVNLINTTVQEANINISDIDCNAFNSII